MKVIFLGTTGVHHTLAAARIYIDGVQPSDLYDIHEFADQAQDHTGHPILVGRDKQGNDVYSLGAGKDVLMAQKSIEELIGILGFYPHDLLVKPIKVKGDIFFPFLNQASHVIGGKVIGKLIARYLENSEMNRITEQVEAFKDHYQLH